MVYGALLNRPYSAALLHSGMILALVSTVILSPLLVSCAPAAALPCSAASSSVPHSNTSTAPCADGAPGDVCPFVCDAGFVASGAHVCQSYTTASGVAAISHAYFGGRCLPLCAGGGACGAGLVPVRQNATSADGWCLATACRTPADALLSLARGNYALWQRGRFAPTGMSSDAFDATADAAMQSNTAHLGSSAIALIFDCVAVEMNWTLRADAQRRANTTLRAFAGELPGFALPRTGDGWLPTQFDRRTGAAGAQVGTVFDSGSSAAAVLFAREWWTATSAARDGDAAARALTASIARLAKKVYNLVNFTRFPVNASGWPAPDGTFLPSGFSASGQAAVAYPPLADGYYQFNELHYTVWLQYEQACAGAAAGACAAPGAGNARMWANWQERRLHPNLAYAGFPLLTYWPSYVTQLPFYLCASFSADAAWAALFRASWEADRAYFASAALYSPPPRYGLAAGPTDRWCSAKNASYEADILAPGSAGAGAQGCKHFSPYAVAGYLPAAPQEVAADLLALLAQGDAVVAVEDLAAGDVILSRRSLLEPQWSTAAHITAIDFCSELFGLTAHLLGARWFHTHAAHNFTALARDAPEWQPGGGEAVEP